MTEISRRTCCHEIISFFTSETGRTPIMLIALDWKIFCEDFHDEGGSITYETKGFGQETLVDEPSVGFLVFSGLGIHKVIYDIEKGNKAKEVLDLSELEGLKVKRLAEGKIQFLPVKKHLFGNPVIFFDTNDWKYIELKEQIYEGLAQVKKYYGPGAEAGAGPGSVPGSASVPKSEPVLKPETVPTPDASPSLSPPVPVQVPSAKAREKPQPKKEFHLFGFASTDKDRSGDYYDEILSTVREDIKRIKNRKNKAITREALKKMEDAADIIRNCDTRIKASSKRTKGLASRREQLAKSISTGELQNEHIKELDRKLEIEHRLILKEKNLREQKLTQFHGLREAIETIRTSEERLSAQDVDVLIDAAIRSEVQTKDIEKAQKKLDSYR